MKKLLIILVTCLLLSGNAFAGWFDKDKIKVTKCWDRAQYSSFKDQQNDSANSHMSKWEWELNLKNNKAIRTVIIDGQLSLDQFIISIITDDYIIVKNNGYVDGDYQFDRQNEVYITSLGNSTIKLKCKFR